MKFLLKILIAVVIVNFILPDFSFAQEASILKAPEGVEEVKEFGINLWQNIKNQLPDLIRKSWEQEVLPLWRKMAGIWSQWWDNNIQPWLQKIWQKFMNFLGQEVEKRKPYVEEEFQKEKEEMIEEVDERIPEKGRSLWERFKELIQ